MTINYVLHCRVTKEDTLSVETTFGDDNLLGLEAKDVDTGHSVIICLNRNGVRELIAVLQEALGE